MSSHSIISTTINEINKETMGIDRSFRRQIRSIFSLPSKLQQTRNKILENEGKAIRKIGTWKCPCGHMNSIYHHPAPSPYPLGIMCCRSCSTEWQGFLRSDTSILSEEYNVQFHEFIDVFHACERANNKPARIIAVSALAPGHLSWGYICAHDNCGLTWRLVEQKVSPDPRRNVLKHIDGAGRRLCDCGGGLFQRNKYTIFEVMVCPPVEAISVKGSELMDAELAPVVEAIPPVPVHGSRGDDGSGVAMMSGANGMG